MPQPSPPPSAFTAPISTVQSPVKRHLTVDYSKRHNQNSEKGYGKRGNTLDGNDANGAEGNGEDKKLELELGEKELNELGLEVEIEEFVGEEK